MSQVQIRKPDRWLRLCIAMMMAFSIAAGIFTPTPASADFGAWSTTYPSDYVSSIAIDPTNAQVIYASGTTGIRKTTNGGGSWSLVSPQTPYRLAVDPFAPSTLYAISGTVTSGPRIANTNLVVKSTNGGVTWNTVYTASLQLNDILVNPNTANAVYVALGSTGSGSAQVARSLDGGATWGLILPPNIGQGGIGGSQATSLAMVPGAPDLLYVGIQVYHGGSVMKTTNANASPMPTWSEISGNVQPLSAPWMIATSGTPANHSLYSNWTVQGISALGRSDNDGAWVAYSNNLPGRSSGQTSSITGLVGNPYQAAWVYASFAQTTGTTLGVFASPDGGQNWTEMGHLDRGVIDLKLAAHAHTLYAATGNGVYQLLIKWPVASRFADFYNTHDGLRLLGSGISTEYPVYGHASQYFEKGRIEDHQGESNDPNWRFMYGLLVDELQQAKVKLPIGGDVSSMTYADLNTLADPSKRVPPPAGYPGNGAWTYVADGTTFIPFTADLHGSNGHLVLGGFWNYINRRDLFPGGWLHDVGLPISEAVTVKVTKDLAGGPVQRTITVQAFQRTILTDDPLNPPDWQVERANAGTDYRKAFPALVGP